MRIAAIAKFLFRPFTIDLAKPITFDMMSPKITLTGPYNVEGKVLILPIVGKGNATIVLGKRDYTPSTWYSLLMLSILQITARCMPW